MIKKKFITRRRALRQGLTLAAATAASARFPLFLGATAKSSSQPVAESALLGEFGYGQVQFAAGAMQQQFEENHRLLLGLDEDSLLRPYRIRQGMPAPGPDLGGWYDTNAFAPGFTYGQWMSALSRMYAATGDEATRAKVSRMVHGFAATIEPSGKFYLENRFPAYIYDKLVCGLIDAHTFAHDPQALVVLSRATEAVSTHLPPHAMPHREAPLTAREDFTEHAWDESYTMPENLFLAWRRSGNPQYRELARRFIFHEYFDPLSRNENVLPGRHAYSHVNSLCSAAATYLALGDEKYLRTAKNGFDFVQQQSFATGGWGPNEHFVVPGSGKLAESLFSTHASFETPCGAYAHFKLTRYLLRITKDSRYGDSMERVLYNTILGVKPLRSDGSAFYYSDYNFNGRRTFHPDKWPCCSGTLPQIAADYRISAYFQSAHGVYVNLYSPGSLTWHSAGKTLTLRQTTDYPYDSAIRFDLESTAPSNFSVFLRIPEWAKGASLTVNGAPGSIDLVPGTFAELRRDWKNSDRIELFLPFATRLEAIDAEHPDTVALLTGPLVLMMTQPAVDEPPAGSTDLTRALLLSANQRFPRSHSWNLRQPPESLAGTRTDALIFKPFLDIQDETYATYFRVPARERLE